MLAVALILGRALLLRREDVAELLRPHFLATESPDKELERPQAKALLKQARDAWIGLPLLGVGFFLQMLGVVFDR